MIVNFLANWLQLEAAGIWSFIWNWGLGIGVIILCGIGIVFTDSIPVIGPWLGRERKGLLVIAIVTGAVLLGEFIGARDSSRRCTAKTVVIEKIVTKVVHKAKTDKSADPYDSPNN